MSSPDFWNDSAAARATIDKKNALEAVTGPYETLAAAQEERRQPEVNQRSTDSVGDLEEDGGLGDMESHARAGGAQGHGLQEGADTGGKGQRGHGNEPELRSDNKAGHDQHDQGRAQEVGAPAHDRHPKRSTRVCSSASNSSPAGRRCP